MYFNIPLIGSLTLIRWSKALAARPTFAERISYADTGRTGCEYLLASGRWDLYFTPARTLREDLRTP